eukprot:TRINITY_DN9122_c0_g1_i1.p1 TRINITY_DN9122_c0_g1~~TRINITY_DN9122_c0_g1_i1.p1  ORF type:complete len:516 (-),score=234.42 TRINITY_DN9122_c0_g1_i1:55-1473(-)
MEKKEESEEEDNFALEGEEEHYEEDEEDGLIVEDEANITFRDLGIDESLIEATVSMGFAKPRPIQIEAIPYALQGKDIIGLAQTGSGKTAAFALPILQELLKKPQPFFACVMCPARELATQISKHFEGLGSSIGVKSTVIVGGVDTMVQSLALAKRPHIIVGTPGRILWHLENTKGFSLASLKFLVMDEADRLLNMDFEEEINKLLTLLPRERRTFLFSATMTGKVQKLQRASLNDPVKIEIASKYQTVERLVQNYLLIPAKYKDCYLAYIVNEYSSNSIIIFASTRKDVQRLAFMLRNLGFSAIPLHGQLQQNQRYGSINKFSSGSSNILIATDVASRGLHMKVDLVINYDIPNHAKDYIHRVGRTARGDKNGKAVSLVTQYDVELYQRIEELIKKKLDRFPVEEEEVLVMMERVTEAQRFAAVQLRESGAGSKKGFINAEGEENEEEEAGNFKKRKAKTGSKQNSKKNKK